jgi:leucyl-tRNA synthetase
VSTEPNPPAGEQVPYRYDSALAAKIEAAWQDRWDAEGTFETPNPAGDLAGPQTPREKYFLMDMFPYPSGVGLHVGHPLGYIATDVIGRYQRMLGRNVLHALGYDAFGLPAEQYAVQTGQHPRTTTVANMGTMRRQLRRMGLAHDPRRSFATIEPRLRALDAVDLPAAVRVLVRRRPAAARPINDLVAQLETGTRPTPDGAPWDSLSPAQQRAVVDSSGWPTSVTSRSTGAPDWDRAGQRGGHLRRTQRTAATSRSSSAACASGTCASAPTRTG